MKTKAKHLEDGLPTINRQFSAYNLYICQGQ